MKPIIILEPNVANKIAAGEVVERPASIVKELLENSLDAGATAITVEFRGGGIDYIRITDNGSGIPEEDVPRAFLRHATSKLSTADELESISSFGFRGEALASIAAVSKVTMRTRTADADCGTLISFEGGRQTALEPCACPVGTTIEVNELFYNVPARLKFVKNLRTEAALITDYASRLMLANTGVSIKLINSGRTVIHTFGDNDLANTIFSVYGNSVFASMYKVEYDDGYMRINGYVGGELTARSNRLQQSVFINHRYIKSPIISNAVQRAFLTRLMNHRFPFFVLDILLSAREVDVNVHPNKLSVRFSDEDRIASTITRAVTTALEGEKAGAEYPQITSENIAEFKKELALEFPKRPIVYDDPKSSEQPPVTNSGANEESSFSSDTKRIEESVRELFSSESAALGTESFKKLDDYRKNSDLSSKKTDWTDMHLGDSADEIIPSFSYALPDISDIAAKDTADNKSEPGSEAPFAESKPSIPIFSVKAEEPPYKKIEIKAEQLALDASRCHIIGTAFDTYIIVQQDDAIYYIDQHAAHERMLYEKLIAGELRFDSQLVAPPLKIELDPISLDCVLRNIERFREFGYSLEIDDNSSLSVSAVPSIIEVGAERFLRDTVDMLLEYPAATEIDLLRAKIIKKSCKRAVKAGNRLDIKQLQAIVDAYAEGNVPLTCPHGRPVLIKVTKTDLEKMFKRIV